MAFVSTSVSAAPIVVKWGDAAPKSFSYWEPMQAFKAEVEKKLPGKVDLQLFGDGVLGDQKTVLEQTTMGAIQICTVPSLVTTNIVPEHQVLDLPFVFPNQRAFSDFLVSSEGQRLGALFEKHGLKLLVWSGMNGTDVQNSTYKYVEVQVRYSGSQPLNLNDTTIQIMTSESEANLQYRNGTPYRDMNGGFYTQ